MNSRLFLKPIILFIIYSCICASARVEVTELNDINFDTEIHKYKVSLVMFYAEFCVHCKQFMPEFGSAAEHMRKSVPPVKFLTVECTESGDLTCEKFRIREFPSFKIFRDGRFSQDYTGPKEKSEIIKHMMVQAGPASKELFNVDDIAKFRASVKDSVIIGFFQENNELKRHYLYVADKLRGKYKFAHTSAENLMGSYTLYNNVALFRPDEMHNTFEDDRLVFKGSKEGMENFLINNFHGLVGLRTYANMREYNNPLIVAYYQVDFAKNSKNTKYWRNRILQVASQYKSKFKFAISSKDEFKHEISEFGVNKIDTETPMILARDARNIKYKMSESFTVEAFEDFIKGLINKTVEPIIKSQPIPKNNDKRVKIAVGKTFDDIVIKNDKDTMIEFYAPWCMHCKELAPIYDEVARRLIDENLDMVNMDATSNDSPSPYIVKGYPTVFFAKKQSKNKPILYEGGRNVDDFIKFIAKHATEELKSYDRDGNWKREKGDL